MNLLLDMIKYAKEIYDNDCMEAVYSSDIITEDMLNGEYRILRKLERYVDELIEDQEAELKKYEGGRTDV